MSRTNRDKLFDFEWKAPKEYNTDLVDRRGSDRSILGSNYPDEHTDNMAKMETFVYRAFFGDTSKRSHN